MSRWDAILSLPVQSPPSLEFSASDLVWSKVEGWKGQIDRVALIPFARVDDFVKGESSNKDCPTGFIVEARRRRRPESSLKIKVDGVLEYILYWCSFGPDDHRKGGAVRPSRTKRGPKKSAGRPNTKRGCTCHFIMKRLCAEPSVALLIYNKDKHVDKKGLPCHGPQDKKAAGHCAMYAPYISEELRLRLHSLIHVGVSVETIMQRHNEAVEKQGGPCNRDDLLTHRYVRRQERSIRRSKYDLDDDDDVSLSMWVDNHQSNVFFYEDFTDSDPFTIGIQTGWQLLQMIQFGNRSLLASDSRFGNNKFKYPVHSLLVFNSENKAIPVAWVISPKFSSRDAYKWMRALYNRAIQKDPSWKLAGFIIDDPSSDIMAIRDVFECSVLISLWRVRHAWHKNLIKRCSQNEMRVQMSRTLGQIVTNICKGGNLTLHDDFMKDFSDNSEFIEYFKAVWHPQIGSWITGLQTFPLASQETSSAIEFYHQQMNVRVLNEKNPAVYQRVDWLVDKLATKVHSYFWLDEYPGKDEFSRYWKDEWVNGLTPWRNSLDIPDTDVVLEDQYVKVIDHEDREKFHLVSNPGSEFSICDCTPSEMGNLCEHICKATRVCRRKDSSKSSLSLDQYKKTLIKMLHCVPYDSVIRDHAVSLVAFLQNQINAMAGFKSSEKVIDDIEQQPAFSLPSGNDRCLDIQMENLSDPNGRYLTRGNESCDESSFHDEMEIDPSSICVSPSGLFAMHGVLPADILSVSGEKALLKNFTDMNGNDPSCDDLSGQDRSEDMVDEPQATDLSFAMEPEEPCSVIHQFGDKNPDIIGGPDYSSILDTDPLSGSRSATSTAEHHLTKKQKISCGENC